MLLLSALLLGFSGLVDSSVAQDIEVSEVYIGDNGRFNIQIDGPAGEYFVECTTSLLEPITWAQICRFNSDGATTEANDPIDDSPVKFYRVVSIPASDPTYLTGTYSDAIVAGVPSADIGRAGRLISAVTYRRTTQMLRKRSSFP